MITILCFTYFFGVKLGLINLLCVILFFTFCDSEHGCFSISLQSFCLSFTNTESEANTNITDGDSPLVRRAGIIFRDYSGVENSVGGNFEDKNMRE